MGIESKIWVFVEQRRGQIAEAGFEILGKAKELAKGPGWKVAAVLLGKDVGGLTERVLAYGPDELIVADHELLEDYCSETYTKTFMQAIGVARPEVILMGATAMGTDLAPRLAARLRTGLSAHCIDLELNEKGELFAMVPGWGGNFAAKIGCPVRRPQMATVMPGIFPLPEPGEPKGKIVSVDADLKPEDVTYKVVETLPDEAGGGDLAGADVVVTGGWGIGGKENWAMIEELAAELGGAVGATRPAVDEGWADEHRMIGTSGCAVSPKLYIGVAVSGHTHHLVGLKNIDHKIAINKDPDAPIFGHCGTGLLGDFKEIVPALIEAIRERK